MKELLVPILLLVNLALTGAVLGMGMSGMLIAAPMAAEGEAAEGMESTEVKPAFYHEFKPEIVVNFPGAGQPRYMQMSLTAVTGDEAAIAALELHAPAIRNDLLMLFSGIEPEPLATREGKEKMLNSALETVRGIMQKRYGQEAVEEMYFTRFVMQ
ncbi:MAG: flagellar FliL protein [Gammaproteobacteria bacterium]|jgi:flagellar FliL protein